MTCPDLPLCSRSRRMLVSGLGDYQHAWAVDQGFEPIFMSSAQCVAQSCSTPLLQLNQSRSEYIRGVFAGLKVCKAIWLLCLIKAVLEILEERGASCDPWERDSLSNPSAGISSALCISIFPFHVLSVVMELRVTLPVRNPKSLSFAGRLMSGNNQGAMSSWQHLSEAAQRLVAISSGGSSAGEVPTSPLLCFTGNHFGCISWLNTPPILCLV